MTLHLYFARRFAMMLLGVTLSVGAMLTLIDLVEEIRRFSGQSVGFAQVATLTLLNVPSGLYRIMPLIMILATLALFLSLARSSELVVTRASGRSALRSVAAPATVAALTGVVAIVALNPIVAATSERYEVLIDRFRGLPPRALSVSEEGLWLRQGDEGGQTVIHASASNADGTVLRDVTFYGFDPQGRPAWRVAGRSAELRDGAWNVADAKRWQFDTGRNPETESFVAGTMMLPSNLTREEIVDSFGDPSAIPVWELPAFISRLEAAGFAARTHRVWLHMELANPLIYAAMVVIAATFTLRHRRFGRTGPMVAGALLMAFSLYFVRNFAQILGENGQVPVLLAAWGPPSAALLLPLGILLHLEDG